MWPQAPARVTAPQAAVEELHLEGAPTPGCRAGLQLRAAPHGQLSSAFSQWPSLLPSAHWGAGKVRREQQCPDSPGSVQGKQHSHGTWHTAGRWRNKGEDKETCANRVITGRTRLLYPLSSVWAPCASAHLGQGLGGCKEDLLTEISALLVTHVQLSMHCGSNICKNASCFW